VETEEASDPDRSSSDENASETEHKGPYKIPKVKHMYTKAQVEEYKRDFSFLAEKSDDFIRGHSVTELIRLDNKLGGGKGKGHRKLTERMARNLERIKKVPDKDSHPTRDFDSYHDLRMGLATLRLATHQIFWWNFSVECLDYFMNGVKFGETLFGYRPDQAQLNFVTDFIDQVIHINS
jgi:hypothetical protein